MSAEDTTTVLRAALEESAGRADTYDVLAGAERLVRRRHTSRLVAAAATVLVLTGAIGVAVWRAERPDHRPQPTTSPSSPVTRPPAGTRPAPLPRRGVERAIAIADLPTRSLLTADHRWYDLPGVDDSQTLSPDGRYLSYQRPTGGIVLHNLATGTDVTVPGDDIRVSAWSPGSRWALVDGTSQTTTRIDLTTGARVENPWSSLPDNHRRLVNLMSVTDQGNLVAALAEQPVLHDDAAHQAPVTVAVIDPDRGTTLRTFTIPKLLTWHRERHGGRWRAVPLSTAYLWPSSGRNLIVRVTDNGDAAQTRRQDGATRVYDLSTGTRLRDLPTANQMRILAGGPPVVATRCEGTQQLLATIDPETGRVRTVGRFDISTLVGTSHPAPASSVPGCPASIDPLTMPGQIL